MTHQRLTARQFATTATTQTPARRTARIAPVPAIATLLSVGIVLAPWARADSVADLSNALAQARTGTSCPPLHSQPIVGQAAHKITQSNNDWLDHTATQVPIADPLPGLKILGYPGNKGTALQGAGKTEANAIKGVLLEGYDKIPDCSYTDYGVSTQQNQRTGWYLATAVLAGP